MFSSRRLVQCQKSSNHALIPRISLIWVCPGRDLSMETVSFAPGVISCVCRCGFVPGGARPQMGSKSGFRRERNGPYSSPSLFRTRHCVVPWPG